VRSEFANISIGAQSGRFPTTQVIWVTRIVILSAWAKRAAISRWDAFQKMFGALATASRSTGTKIANGTEESKYRANATGATSQRGIRTANSEDTGSVLVGGVVGCRAITHVREPIFQRLSELSILFPPMIVNQRGALQAGRESAQHLAHRVGYYKPRVASRLGPSMGYLLQASGKVLSFP
jgi:hypothetical protein